MCLQDEWLKGKLEVYAVSKPLGKEAGTRQA